MSLSHLARRFIGSLSATRLTDVETMLVRNVLLPREMQLFVQLSRADQRHALSVLQRFDLALPSAAVEVRRAALLHDIGKVDLSLGVFARVFATLVGSRTQKFARYHAHEARGVAMLERVGSSEVTLQVLRGDGDATLVEALRNADNL